MNIFRLLYLIGLSFSFLIFTMVYLLFSFYRLSSLTLGGTCGIYPLLDDNTSYFITADFDEKNWLELINNVHKKCSEFKIPSYIERSRSGNVGHLWIFFKSACSAEQSRKIMFELLRHAGIISHIEKESGFDRLFPNQDFRSGKGMGNLIARPLNGLSIKSGNSCFINPETFEPYTDQWEFLKSVRKVSIDKLKVIYQELFDEIPQDRIISLTDEFFQFGLSDKKESWNKYIRNKKVL